jgi:hypothetical protein
LANSRGSSNESSFTLCRVDQDDLGRRKIHSVQRTLASWPNYRITNCLLVWALSTRGEISASGYVIVMGA